MRFQHYVLSTIFSLSLTAGYAASVANSVTTREHIESDWFLQERIRTPSSNDNKGIHVTPESDAAGAFDGVINGQWGFHTEREENPWWQIDLGTATELDRIVLYNRTELYGRASRIIVRLSCDGGTTFETVYQHDGTPFLGFADKKPLTVPLKGKKADTVRLQLPGTHYFHLDEVQIYTPESSRNIAPGKQATQSSTSQWSRNHSQAKSAHRSRTAEKTGRIIQRGRRLIQALNALGAATGEAGRKLDELEKAVENTGGKGTERELKELYCSARSTVRQLAFSNPLLDFDDILFVKRAPGTLPHMSDQYYGWWSRPGGGIYLLKDFKTAEAELVCLTGDWDPGSFLRPALSYDAKRVLFSYCRYYEHVSGMEKVDKEKLPEDAFYNLFEMHLDGSGVKQITRGRYDDFDGRYLPDGGIVFLSTRKGQFVQCTETNTRTTLTATCPDSYVRCGGDNRRPCAVFTLHTMDPERTTIRPISAFENFEWTPSVMNDGRILYARWDYIDRFNGHFMSLWSTNTTGTNPQLVYGNFTRAPQCVFEARSIPGSHRIVFTGSAHHSITGGSLAVLDPDRGNEKTSPVTRLTPEVCFPEAEGWPTSYYANPYPLSERFFLTSWSPEPLPPHRGSSQVKGSENPVNTMGIYLYDTFGSLELIYRDPGISCMNPLGVKPRKKPPVYPQPLPRTGGEKSFFFVQDIYEGLDGIKRGTVKRVRIIAVPPKTQPHMNRPNLGVSREDPGKYLLGEAPVEPDGSAFFHVPPGVPVFFQAVQENGVAVQTMRTLTYGQGGQTLSCIGCHEPRKNAPSVSRTSMAALRPPSKLMPGPPGSWPLEFDKLVQPVLNRACTSCHTPRSSDRNASRFNLTSGKSYSNLLAFDNENLKKSAFERDRSKPGSCTAAQSSLLAIIKGARGHKALNLTKSEFRRIVIWMDLYAHRQGHFSRDQKQKLTVFRKKLKPIIK